MKKIYRFLLLSFVLVVGLFLSASGIALASTIALWNFNSSTNTVSTDNAVGTPTMSSVGTTTFTYGTPSGASNAAVRLNWGTTTSDTGAQWVVNLTGYSGIAIDVDMSRSQQTNPSSPLDYQYLYSLDAGSTWSAPQYFSLLNNADFQHLTWTLPSVVDGDGDFVFRLLRYNSTSTRYTYVDNFTVSGNAVPIPAAAWLLGTGLVGLVALRRKAKK